MRVDPPSPQLHLIGRLVHIVQLISHYVPAVRYGGPQQVAHGLGRALVKKGHRVSVCTTNLQDEKEDLDVPLAQPVDVDGVQVYYFRTRWSRYWGYAPGMRPQAKKLIAEADAVIVHFHYQYANYVGACLARMAGKPYVLFAHGSFKKDAIKRRSRWLKSSYLRLLEFKNLTSAQSIIFNAEEEINLSHFGERGIVLPNAIEPDDFASVPQPGLFRAQIGIAEDERMFLFLGRIDYRGKGLDLLLDALASLRADRIRVVFAGPDERRGVQELWVRAKQLKIDHLIATPGMITGADKLAALADADAFLLPSRSEGLSIALLEALYLGIPVLTTDQVGLHEQVTGLGAGVVVPATMEGIRKGLTEILNDEKRNAMRGKATPWISEHHTWSSIAEQILPLVEKATA